MGDEKFNKFLKWFWRVLNFAHSSFTKEFPEFKTEKDDRL